MTNEDTTRYLNLGSAVGGITIDEQYGTTILRDGFDDPIMTIDGKWDEFDASTRWTAAPRYQAAFQAIAAGVDGVADTEDAELFTVVRAFVTERARRRSEAKHHHRLTSRAIVIDSTAVDRFKSTWPCHGLDEVDHLNLLENHGDLVDLEAYDEDCNPIECDGEALAALVDEAIKGAKIQKHAGVLVSWVYA